MHHMLKIKSKPQGMCKHNYGNQDFFPIGQWCLFIVSIKKIPLFKGNSLIMDPIIWMEVAHTFEPNILLKDFLQEVINSINHFSIS